MKRRLRQLHRRIRSGNGMVIRAQVYRPPFAIDPFDALDLRMMMMLVDAKLSGRLPSHAALGVPEAAIAELSTLVDHYVGRDKPKFRPWKELTPSEIRYLPRLFHRIAVRLRKGDVPENEAFNRASRTCLRELDGFAAPPSWTKEGADAARLLFQEGGMPRTWPQVTAEGGAYRIAWKNPAAHAALDKGGFQAIALAVLRERTRYQMHKHLGQDVHSQADR